MGCINDKKQYCTLLKSIAKEVITQAHNHLHIFILACSSAWSRPAPCTCIQSVIFPLIFFCRQNIMNSKLCTRIGSLLAQFGWHILLRHWYDIFYSPQNTSCFLKSIYNKKQKKSFFLLWRKTHNSATILEHDSIFIVTFFANYRG